MHEKDFVNEEPVEFEIEGRKFTYKPVTAGDELKWIQEYIEVIDRKTVQNFEKKTICKLRNILKVPYDSEVINKIIKVNKSWENLDKKQRWEFLSKLQPSLFDKIIIKINKIDISEDIEVKKN